MPQQPNTRGDAPREWNWRRSALTHATSSEPARAPRSSDRAPLEPNSRCARARCPSFEHDLEPLVALAFIFRARDANSSYLARVGDVCPTISLLVDAFDVDDADFSYPLGQQIDPRADQVWDFKRFLPRKKADGHGMPLDEQLIRSLLDLLQSLWRKIGSRKSIRARSGYIWPPVTVAP